MSEDQPIGQTHAQHTQAKAAAEAHIVTQGARRHFARTLRHGDIDQIGDRLPCDGLMQQGQGKAGLEFDHKGRLIPPDRQHIDRADLSLDGIALRLEIGFHGGVKIAFLHWRFVLLVDTATIPQAGAIVQRAAML